MRDQLGLPPRPPLFLADPADAAKTYARLAAWLAAGAQHPTHPFRLPVVSTVDDRGHPDSRIVVLRAFDTATREVVFHTDIRSPKVTHLRAHPRCGALFYDPDARLQVRARCTAVVHHLDDRCRREFDALPPHTRATYADPHPPGDVAPFDAPYDYPPRPPVDEGFAFRQFAAVVCAVAEMDVLELHADGHRRVRLRWEGGVVKCERLAP